MTTKDRILKFVIFLSLVVIFLSRLSFCVSLCLSILFLSQISFVLSYPVQWYSWSEGEIIVGIAARSILELFGIFRVCLELFLEFHKKLHEFLWEFQRNSGIMEFCKNFLVITERWEISIISPSVGAIQTYPRFLVMGENIKNGRRYWVLT
jgi:hypothetical protein